MRFESERAKDKEGNYILMNVQSLSDLLNIEVKSDYFIIELDQQSVEKSGSHEILVSLDDDGPPPKFPNEYSFFFHVDYEEMPYEELEVL